MHYRPEWPEYEALQPLATHSVRGLALLNWPSRAKCEKVKRIPTWKGKWPIGRFPTGKTGVLYLSEESKT